MQISSARTLSLLALLLASPAFATLTSYNPLNMPVGSTYTIVFVTVDSVNGTSSDIATYNSIVTTEVATILPTEAAGLAWCAVVSTPTVNAVDNCGQGADAGGAIYNYFDGNEVQDSFTDFTSQALLNTVTQFDGGVARFVWTGSTAGGIASANPLSSSQITIGEATAGVSNGFDFALNNKSSFNDLYAMAEITVDSPEPSSIGMASAGVSVLLIAAYLKSRTRG
jgi:hypothetical protein